MSINKTVMRIGTRTVSIREDSISVHLPQKVLTAAWNAAEKASAHYAAMVDLAKSPYGDNSVERHYNGKIGEFGAHYLFGRLGPMFHREIPMDPIFMDEARDSECDLVVNGLRIEIKTWRPVDYNSYGPCIAERQAKKLAKKADVVVYCCYNHNTNEFALRGWNYVQDIDGIEPVLTGRPGKQVLNRIMEPRVISELPWLTAKA